MQINRPQFLIVLLLMFVFLISCQNHKETTRPNILLLMSDNHSWNHLGCYGDPMVQTPNIDRIAKQGVKFTQAYCAAPSCSPARAGMLTGQDIWRLEEGANLHGTLPSKFPLYTDLLQKSGYSVGCQGKGWGPGNVKESGREFNHGGKQYQSFTEFLESNTNSNPWCFWFSSRNPHRPYGVGSGEASGMDKSQVVVPSYLPDNDAVRGDICDYYHDIQKFDDEVGEILTTLKETGQANNTIIVICSDNGWQMPRGLANLYDFGTRIPMILSWKNKITADKKVDDFVNMNDLAPTFLEIAGLEIPSNMTAKSLTNILFSQKEGRIEKDRDFVVTAVERHALCRLDGKGYPARAIRTDDFLYIRNFHPERWPAGDPPLYGDVDAHMLHYPCPTKMHVLLNEKNPDEQGFFERAFAKRPTEELYDVRTDPDQLNNIADKKDYQEIKKELSNRLIGYLKKTNDPRVTGGEIIWDKAKYYATGDFKPRPNQEAIDLLDLKKEYNYFPEN
ncbi:MAG: sulfatase [Bacteroidota bacterium]